MITESMMYWITRLDYFVGLGVAMLVIGGFFLIVCSTLYIVDRTSIFEDERSNAKIINKWVCSSLIPLILGILIITFVPNTKEYCAIKIIPAIANNGHVQKLGDGMFKIAETWMEKQLGQTSKHN